MEKTVYVIFHEVIADKVKLDEKIEYPEVKVFSDKLSACNWILNQGDFVSIDINDSLFVPSDEEDKETFTELYKIITREIN